MILTFLVVVLVYDKYTSLLSRTLVYTVLNTSLTEIQDMLAAEDWCSFSAYVKYLMRLCYGDKKINLTRLNFNFIREGR